MPVAYDMSWIPSLRRWSKMQFGSATLLVVDNSKNSVTWP